MPRDAQRYRKTYSYYRVQPRTELLEVIVDETLDWKDSVRAASTGNHSLTGVGTTLTVGGVTVVDEDRVLLKDQSTGSQNGIYYFEVSGGNYTFTRASDARTGTLSCGASTFVEEGTNAGKIYFLTTTNPIAIDSTSLTWTEFSSGGGGGSSPVYWFSTTADAAYTTGSVVIRGGLGSVDAASDIGSNVFFFVSGSITGSGSDDKKAVFGGDVVMSGTLQVAGDVVEIAGSLTVTNGISGSLTKLADGTSYLRAGTNITITTGSNGAVTIDSSGGGGVGGTGTVNYIPKFTATTDIGDSVLSEGVGEGNSVPTLTPFITSSADGLKFTANQNWYFPSNNTSALTVNNLFRLSTASGGQLGIGTTSVAQRLHVAISESSTADPISNDLPRVIRLQNTDASNGNSTAIVNADGSGNTVNSYIRFINVDHTKAGAITLGTADGTTEGERFRIDESGNVGIGSVTPTSIGTDVFLFVSGSSGSLGTTSRGVAAFGGDVRISGSLVIGTGSVKLTSNDIQFGSSGMRIEKNGNDMKFFDLSNAGGFTLSELAAAGGGGSSGPIYWTSNTAGEIYTTGSVGIGTNNASEKLHVYSSLGNNSRAIIESETDSGTPVSLSLKSGNPTEFKLELNAEESLLVLSEAVSGKRKLFIGRDEGNMIGYLPGDRGETSSSGLFVTGSVSAADTTLIAKSGYTNGSSLGVLDVRNKAGSTLLWVSGSGYVGIGTSGASALTNTLKSVGSNVVSIHGPSASALLFEVNGNFSGSITASDSGMIIVPGANRVLSLGSDNSVKMVVENDGDVNIQTTNRYFDASIASGQGIRLRSSPENSDAQVLDCYNEPADLSSGIDCTGNEGSGVYVLDASYDTLKMTRIGRLVTIGGDLRIDSLGDTPAGRLYINLGTSSGQYPAMDTAASVYLTGATDLSSAIATSIQAYVEAGTQRMYIDGYLDGFKVDIATQVGAGVTIKVSATYAV